MGGRVKPLDVTIPGLHLLSEANERGQWYAAARRTKEHRRLVRLVLRTRKAPPLPAVVTLVRVAPLPLDDDNLARALKAIRDEVAVWLNPRRDKHGRIIGDDRDPRITWQVAEERGPHAVRILVRSWSETEVGARVTRTGTRLHLEAVLTAAQRVALGRALIASARAAVTFHDADLRLTVHTAKEPHVR